MPTPSLPVDPDLPEPRSRHLAGRPRRSDALLVVALGGALGCLARWGLTRALPVAPDVPWATLTANLVGCLALGALMVVVVERRRGHPLLRPFLGVGVLGGFTTFSTYALDARALVADDRALLALGYVAGSLVGGLLATVVGLRLARAVTRR
ncbi:CrcB family protein [Angustibacter peucedani]